MDPKITIGCILSLTLFLFIWGKWRYDFVAIVALLATVVTGLISPDEAFLGFGHPAVITVAAVFSLSGAMERAGVIDYIYDVVSKIGKGFVAKLTVLNVVIAALSGFMNNIGAMAILLPVTMQVAKKCEKSSSQFLMPVAFSSLLGGMITMIGTPPNIIVATMREEIVGNPFGMFDFTPVGIAIAITGILFLSLVGWRFLPMRKGQNLKEEIFEIEGYVTELKVTEKSTCINMTLREFESSIEGDVTVLGIVRNGKQLFYPSGYDQIHTDDILIVEVDSESLKQLIEKTAVELAGDTGVSKEILSSEDVRVVEVVIKADSSMIGQSIAHSHLRWRYGINLLAVSRAGKKFTIRLNQIRFQPGDVLLLRGKEEMINEALPQIGCLPLQYRGYTVGEPRRILLCLGIFGLAITSVVLGLFPIQIAFMLAVVCMHLFGLLRLKEIYESIDWRIIVLLGAMLPVGKAMETSGAATFIAEQIVSLGKGNSPTLILGIVLVGTMFLSDLVNNATAAVLMVPIAARIAQGIEVSPDSFLMAVAIGASCPFLTPIGHQCNAIILGPGGYRFGDYFRMGLPLEVLIVAVGIPLLHIFWPF